MKKIAVIGDTHLLSHSYRSRSLFPAMIDSLEKDRRNRRYQLFRRMIEECHQEVLFDILVDLPDMLIHVGDLTCGWQERGIGYGDCTDITRGLIDAIYRQHMLHGKFRMCWGNQDVGYGGPNGLLDPYSLRVCSEIAPLFWKTHSDGILWIGICSPLLEPTQRSIPEVAAQADEQRDFIADTLRANDGRPWVLCMHDISVGQHLAGIIDHHMDDLQAVVFGHTHSRWAGVLSCKKGYLQPYGIGSAIRRKGVACPSVAPLWWRGGGFLSGLIEHDTVSFKQQTSSYGPLLDRLIQQSPLSNPATCLYWVVRDAILKGL